MHSRHSEPQKIQGYAPLNGLKMYYEIEGPRRSTGLCLSCLWICRSAFFSCAGSNPKLTRCCNEPTTKIEWADATWPLIRGRVKEDAAEIARELAQWPGQS
jgi:hypothetical protein